MSQNSGSYLSAQPGFLNGAPSRQPPVAKSWLSRFWSEEVTHPGKIWGNASLSWSMAFFAAGVVFIRKAGWILVPAF